MAFDRWIRTVGQANYGCAQLVDTWLHVPGQSSWEPSDSSTALSTDFRQAWTVWDVAWEAITALGAEQVNDNAGLEAWYYLLDALEAGAWLLLLTGDSVVVATQPDLTCDTDARLHSEVGPAFKWNDIELWYWHGVNVWPTVVLHPESIELRDIMHYGMNAEVRRVLIERYGEGRFLTDSGADCLDDDPRFGVLWHKGVSHDEPLVFLELTNATPEPTGVYKHFWLRVPPTMHTAREAVAWTFGLNTGGYRPIIES